MEPVHRQVILPAPDCVVAKLEGRVGAPQPLLPLSPLALPSESLHQNQHPRKTPGGLHRAPLHLLPADYVSGESYLLW